MSLNNVTPGKNLPESFNVVIEIPAESDPVKYEVDKESGAVFVDRFLTTAMYYPCNYGYVPQTLSGDGDPVDVLVITPYPLLPAALPVLFLPPQVVGLSPEHIRFPGTLTLSPATVIALWTEIGECVARAGEAYREAFDFVAHGLGRPDRSCATEDYRIVGS